jgi:Domain of unknown function (DUF4185)
MRIGLTCFGAFALACGTGAPSASATLWPRADALFHSDSRWIGGDGAYSVDLGAGRVLWLFGDSFIAQTPARVRSQATMVRNSLAIETGYDPSRAFMRFYWAEDDGNPVSFMPEDGADWFWPEGGVRIGDSLVLFYEREQTPPGDPSGFEGVGWSAVRIDDPDDVPSQWKLQPTIPTKDGHGIDLGTAVFREGDATYVYGEKGSGHSLYIARYATADVARGALDQPAWWNGNGFVVGSEPRSIMSLAAPEFSVHHDRRLGRYVLVESMGYGPSTLDWCVADHPEGPWSEPRDLFRPPESFNPDAFVYAGKAHPELTGADLVATYVPSTFDSPPVNEEHLFYYPRFVRLSYR